MSMMARLMVRGDAVLGLYAACRMRLRLVSSMAIFIAAVTLSAYMKTWPFSCARLGRRSG